MGKPELYELQLAFEADGGVSDDTNMRFGIRDVATYFTPEGARGFILNGVPILVRGGGWADDIFLDYNPAKLKAQIEYVRHMNLNALRMEGFFGNNDEIYNLCDENGILLLVGWMCGWEYAHYEGRDTARREQLAAVWSDQVTWLRNHPSIFCWLYGSDLLTRPETERAYLKVFSELDPDRPVCSSAAEVNSKVTGKSGVHMGPYDWNSPRWWYESAKGFDTETGPGIQVPPIEAFKAIMPADKLWPPNAVWNVHASRNKGEGFGTVASHLKAIKQHAGEAADLDDFWRKSELLSYESVRAMYEGWRGKAPQTTGVIMWMLNSAWPKLEWQLYDYSLAPCSAFYATRLANEPLHIQYDPEENSVLVVNGTTEPVENLTARICLFNLDSEQKFAQEFAVPDVAGEPTKVTTLPAVEGLSSVYFLEMQLINQDGKTASQSIYCLSSDKNYDVTVLAGLAEAHVKIDAKTIPSDDGSAHFQVDFENPNLGTDAKRGPIALMVRMHLTKGTANAPLGPVFLDDNYFSLLPGEKRTISGTVPRAALGGEKLHLDVDGWNVKGVRAF